jgi:hypothetical protein
LCRYNAWWNNCLKKLERKNSLVHPSQKACQANKERQSVKGLIKAIIAILLFSHSISSAQTLSNRNGGLNGGLAFNFGSITRRVGLYLGGFYVLEDVQINSTIRLYYNFATFGPSLKGWEIQPSLGLLAAVGNREYRERDVFFSSLGNQTGRKYSLGYSYNFYFDQIGTSQRTGTILIGMDRFELVSENDIFATKRSDRFRTGGVRFSYKNGDFMYSISSILWTGNPQSEATRRVHNSDFPSRFGYVDISEAPFGKFSNGVLAFQVKYSIGNGQEVQGGIGVDSERVRNVFQNKVIHDMYFWPKKWNKARNPHLPMLDQYGEPYLYKEDQKIKRSSAYFDLSLNPGIFY